MEILISVGILAIVSTLLAQVLFTTTHVNKKTEILTDIKRDGNFALDIIDRMVRAASVIETPCTVGATSTPSAKIRNPDNNVTVFTCFSDGNAARIASKSAAGAVVYLTGAAITLSTSGGSSCADSSLSFSCPPASGATQNQVAVTFTLGQIGVSASPYESGRSAFNSTVRMRN